MRNVTMDRIIKPLWSSLTAALILLTPTAGAEQAYFETPQQAADSLVIALARQDSEALKTLLGSDYAEVLPVDQIEKDQLQQFLDGWARFNTLLSNDDKTRFLAVGTHGWTLPVPIASDTQGWHFDTVAGKEVMRVRRIGRNELSTMQAVLAYHDAQTEYATQDRDGDGVLEYAQRFVSSAGQRDGLYWEAAAGQQQSPLGPRFADHEPGSSYHGYRYRILTAQGAHADGGARDYVQNGSMTGGFAVVAWPADYGQTGVMSFLLDDDGNLYESDLGPDGDTVAASMPAFDPDARWAPVLETMGVEQLPR